MIQNTHVHVHATYLHAKLHVYRARFMDSCRSHIRSCKSLSVFIGLDGLLGLTSNKCYLSCYKMRAVKENKMCKT